eukprot:6187519-Pleurochrysis_carterae.AAC.1
MSPYRCMHSLSEPSEPIPVGKPKHYSERCQHVPPPRHRRRRQQSVLPARSMDLRAADVLQFQTVKTCAHTTRGRAERSSLLLCVLLFHFFLAAELFVLFG